MDEIRTEAVAYLGEVRALIERGWSRFHAALNKTGRRVDWASEEATNWSLLGAMFRLSFPEGDRALYVTVKQTLEWYLFPEMDFTGIREGWPSLVDWNASRTDKRQVLRLLDKVIAEVSK